MVRDDFNWQKGAHSLTMGGTFKFIKTNSNLINNFNFVGAGLTGPLSSTGLGPAARPADMFYGPNQVSVNDWDNVFASGLGVIGDISTNFNYNNMGVAQPAGSGGTEELPLLPDRGLLRRHLENEKESYPLLWRALSVLLCAV